VNGNRKTSGKTSGKLSISETILIVNKPSVLNTYTARQSVSYIYAMRQLAAILFADMTGYTALMQDNEHFARQKRKRFRKYWKQQLQIMTEKFYRTMVMVHSAFSTALLIV
jgi:hypothetical protein